MTRVSLVVAFLLTVTLANVSHACSCWHRSIQQTFDNSENVFSAFITASKLLKDGSSEFDILVIEGFKGDIPFRKMRTDSGVCGSSVHVGLSYVFFQSSSNVLQSCPPPEAIDGPWSRDGKETVQTLRDFRDGQIPDLSETWRFSEGKRGCTISRSFTSYGDWLNTVLTFSFRRPKVDNRDLSHADSAERPVSMEVRVDEHSPLYGHELHAQSGDIGLTLSGVPVSSYANRPDYASTLPAARKMLNAIRSVGVLDLRRVVDPGDDDQTQITFTRGQEKIDQFLNCVDGEPAATTTSRADGV